jgi:hypothetical protein
MCVLASKKVLALLSWQRPSRKAARSNFQETPKRAATHVRKPHATTNTPSTTQQHCDPDCRRRASLAQALPLDEVPETLGDGTRLPPPSVKRTIPWQACARQGPDNEEKSRARCGVPTLFDPKSKLDVAPAKRRGFKTEKFLQTNPATKTSSASQGNSARRRKPGPTSKSPETRWCIADVSG